MKNANERVDFESVIIRFFGADELGLYSERQSVSDADIVFDDYVGGSIKELG